MDDIEAELETEAEPGNKTEDLETIKSTVLLHQSLSDPRGLFTTVSFIKSNRKCLKLLREAMLRHDWQEAARYFSCYIQTLQSGSLPQVRSAAPEIMWRIGTEILHHLPNSSDDDFNAFYEQLKHFGIRNYSKISLEHCFHLLLNKQLDEAKRQLFIADSWRYGKQSAAQSLIKKMIRGYCGYLDYLIWCQKKPSVPEKEETINSHEMNSYFRQASVTLKEIISQPGIWDPFVLSYIDMMEFYNDEEAAFLVLENYAYNKDFPMNPNAHVYLYQFLKRHRAPKAKLISSLRVLHSFVPSHELMLELCSLLLSTKQNSSRVEALVVSMDLLEFSNWKCDMRAWNCLLKIMKKLKKTKCLKAIRKEWSGRRSLWLPLHYRGYTAWKDSVQDTQLLLSKRDVLSLTGEGNRAYFKVARGIERGRARRKEKKARMNNITQCLVVK